MNEPLRVVVWGTGNVGKAVIKVAANRKDIDVVGALVYSEAKDGRDIGPIAGIADQGVTATTDRSAVLALAPDCVIYTPVDFGDFRADEDILELLRRGINVVTSLPYQNVAVRGAEVAAAFQRAGEEGGASLFGTGINPGFMPERLAMTATGLVSDMSDVLIEEFYRIGAEPEATLKVFGFGLPAPEDGERPAAVAVVEQLERQFIHFIGNSFGTPITELRYSADWHTTDRDVVLENTVLPARTVAYVTHRWVGVTESGPAVRFQTHWYADAAIGPQDLPCEDYYRISIEGRPSLRIGVELRASNTSMSRLYTGDSTEPVYWAIASTLIQAVPLVVSAAPGVRAIDPPSNAHWRADLRDAMVEVAR